MSSTQPNWTPGPWTVVHEDGQLLIRAGTGNLAGIPDPDDEDQANARLMAAAPDGLEAAQFALSVLRANPVELSERLAIEKVEAFIAKAEGRQS